MRAQTAETAQHVRNVTAEQSAQRVELVDHDVAEAHEKGGPPRVRRQDAGVQHLRVGEEAVRLGQAQDAAGARKWLEFSDRPDWSIGDLIEEIDGLDPDDATRVQERYLAGENGPGRSRMRLAREDDGSVGLYLRDARGQDRLRLVVPADGEPVVEVLDADGVPRSLMPD